MRIGTQEDCQRRNQRNFRSAFRCWGPFRRPNTRAARPSDERRLRTSPESSSRYAEPRPDHPDQRWLPSDPGRQKHSHDFRRCGRNWTRAATRNPSALPRRRPSTAPRAPRVERRKQFRRNSAFEALLVDLPRERWTQSFPGIRSMRFSWNGRTAAAYQEIQIRALMRLQNMIDVELRPAPGRHGWRCPHRAPLFEYAVVHLQAHLASGHVKVDRVSRLDKRERSACCRLRRDME